MSIERRKKNTKLIFWVLFSCYFILYLIFYGELAYEFGLVYIWGIGLTLSFVLAWASSIFSLILRGSHGKKM